MNTENHTSEADARTERDQHCDALQALVDLLRAHPELDSPFHSHINAPIVGFSDEQKTALAAWARAVSHLKPTKHFDKWAALHVNFGGGVELHVYADRDAVCERVVVGTETVTKTVKDPEALAAVPEIEVTEQVEQVEWICSPLLAVEAAS